MVQKTIVFDLDHTICEPDLSQEDVILRYGSALPITSVIERMRVLRRNGFRIVIHTARRMLTHNGDIELIEKDVGQITREWLSVHNVPYDELVFGKPYSDTFYVDDKAMCIDEFEQWVQI